MFFDLPVSRNLFCGLSFDLHNILIYGRQKFMIDVSFAFKYSHEYKRLRMALKPAVSFGYGGLPSYGFMHRTDYLTLKAYVELHFLLPRMHAWIVELGAFAAPVGGNRYDDVSIEPAVLLRIGYII